MSALDVLMAKEYTNRLAGEKSPYLLQHAHNPVDWYPWGEEAFTKARKEDKPVFLSIGYSTCHWCHVMERESFENEEIANILNDHFVAIKVDREERPDIDNIYMSAVMAMTGSGGWPMSVFLTPDKKPFFGGTYFPPEARWGSPGFKEILMSIDSAWKNQRGQIISSGQSLTQALQERGSSSQFSSVPADQVLLSRAYRELEHSFDPQFGGFGSAPKFPMPHSLAFLLRYWKRTAEPAALEMVEKTLTKMAQGGIHDHLGGGFHRYSTDRQWQVPHFEKMLYDQALLARAYLECYQATGKEEYARSARDIFDYVLRDMTSSEGGFFSAEDADSFAGSEEAGHKEEGAFYVWPVKELEDQLEKENLKVFSYYFGIQPQGNAIQDPHGEFSGKNILHVVRTVAETAQHFQKSEQEIVDSFERSKQKLFLIRQKRPRPYLDDKVLVDWNGLMIASLAFGSQVLKEPKYKEAADKAARFILNRMFDPNGRLLHRYRDGDAAITATIDDYAFFICGLLDLYEAGFDPEYLSEAVRLSGEMLRFFWDDAQGGFFFTAFDAESLIFRQKEIYDGAVPSGNSVAALDLVRLAHFTADPQWIQKAEKLFAAFATEIAQRPSAYAQMLGALDFYLGPSMEIVIAEAKEKSGSEDQEMVRSVYSVFMPNRVLILRGAEGEGARRLMRLVPFVEEQVPVDGKATAYVCRNHVCNLPVTDILKFKETLNK